MLAQRNSWNRNPGGALGLELPTVQDEAMPAARTDLVWPTGGLVRRFPFVNSWVIETLRSSQEI